MFLHIDGDILKYRAGFAAEKMWYYLQLSADKVARFNYKKDMLAHCEQEGIESPNYEQQREAEPESNALYNVRSQVRSILESTGTEDYCIYLSGDTNFRDGIATIAEYKGNRVSAKPIHAPAIDAFIREEYECSVSEDEEADDEMAYNHYKMWEEDEYSTAICTIDKDLDMLPGLHFNFVKDMKYYVAEDAAMRNFYMQIITGDAVDNILGCKGLGPAAAARIIGLKGDERSWWDIIVRTYTEQQQKNPEQWPPTMLPHEIALENARLLWIRRHPFELWEPVQ
jgi:5'-3' exonuclease